MTGLKIGDCRAIIFSLSYSMGSGSLAPVRKLAFASMLMYKLDASKLAAK